MPQYTRTVYDGLSHIADQTVLASGCDVPKCSLYNRTTVQAAVADSQLVIICLGTGQSIEAEGHDRSTIKLPGKQLQLLKDAVQFGKSVFLISALFSSIPGGCTFVMY